MLIITTCQSRSLSKRKAFFYKSPSKTVEKQSCFMKHSIFKNLR